MEYDDLTELEPCYLLGDFLVKMQGTVPQLTPFVRQDFYWGDLVPQGFPFYGGNMGYRFSCYLEKGIYEIEASKYRGALLELFLEGKSIGEIIFSPYRLRFSIEEERDYEISLMAYGNRFNTFGALHDCDEKEVYFDPSTWRTSGQSWSYEYQFKKTGILKSPVIRKFNKRSSL